MAKLNINQADIDDVVLDEYKSYCKRNGRSLSKQIVKDIEKWSKSKARMNDDELFEQMQEFNTQGCSNN